MDWDLLKVVFFDAAGTLFRVRGSVGAIYAGLAGKYGVAAEPDEIERMFSVALQAKSAEGFSCDLRGDLEAQEKLWWADVVGRIFPGRMDARTLHEYFEEVYEQFRGADSWELYPDTRASLESLRSMGCRIGVISNFDSRIHDVLDHLGIGFLFDHVVISWNTGFAKPDPRIFLRAAELMGVAPDGTLHVGDSPREDVDGARAAGLNAILLDRDGIHRQYHNGWYVRSLAEIPGRIRGKPQRLS